MKKLSIVVATYNRAPYLLRTLESLARQTLSPGLFEILVVNNNSSDNTPEVVAGFAGSHPQLQVRMVTETSQGISYARNCGIASSVGQYIVFIDDDEEANPEFAKSYFCFFENNPGLDAAGGAVVPVYEAPLPAWYSYYIEKMITGAFDLGDRMVPFRGKRYPGVGNSGFRRRLFDRFGNSTRRSDVRELTRWGARRKTSLCAYGRKASVITTFRALKYTILRRRRS